MLLPSISLSAVGFLGIVGVPSPEERTGVPCHGQLLSPGHSMATHSPARARAQGSEAGEVPPGLSHRARAAHPALPQHTSAAPRLQAGAFKPFSSGRGWQLGILACPPDCWHHPSSGEVAQLPATCLPLQTLLWMDRAISCAPHLQVGPSLWGNADTEPRSGTAGLGAG